MADELDLDLGESTTEEQEKTNKVEKRIKDLSEKVKLTATERDEIQAKATQAEADKTAALKDVDFYKNFSTISSKYEGSAEYQDRIREKVNAGYTMEDAALSVLNAEGKLPGSIPVAPKQSPAGGSAITNLKAGGEKSVSDMTQEERRAQLMEAEKRGDISLS